jgi:hypothetical protein
MAENVSVTQASIESIDKWPGFLFPESAPHAPVILNERGFWPKACAHSGSRTLERHQRG